MSVCTQIVQVSCQQSVVSAIRVFERCLADPKYPAALASSITYVPGRNPNCFPCLLFLPRPASYQTPVNPFHLSTVSFKYKKLRVPSIQYTASILTINTRDELTGSAALRRLSSSAVPSHLFSFHSSPNTGWYSDRCWQPIYRADTHTRLPVTRPVYVMLVREYAI